MKNSARIAEFIFRDESEGRFALGDVAVVASLDGVWVVVGEGFAGDAGVEAEESFGVALEGFAGAGHGLVVWSFGVFILAYLNGCAPAVPAVGRIVGGPEGVGGRECDSGEGRMLGAHMVVAGGAVLEVIAVAVAGDLLPFGGHGGGGVSKVVLGAQVVLIVGFVDRLNVIQKAFEGLSNAILIEQGGEGLIELVESLDAGEDVVGLLKSGAHGVAHPDLTESAVEDVGVSRNEVLRLAGGKDMNVEGSALLAE